MARTPSPPGFEDVHRILGRPMREVAPEQWPARVHAGGPLPTLPELTQLQLALDIAEPIARESRETAACVATTAAITAAGPLAHLDPAFARGVLEAATKVRRGDSAGLRVAKLGLRAAQHYVHTSVSARSSIGNSVADAATAYLEVIAPAEHAWFLGKLDEMIVRHELLGLLASKSLAHAGPAEPSWVIARTRTASGGLGCVLARLAGGEYGLYVKLGARWAWPQGDLPTMFATVPDELKPQVGDALVACQLA